MEKEKPIVILISKNLIFLPRIEAAAGSTMRVRRLTEPGRAEEVIGQSKVTTVLVDLEEDTGLWKPILKELSTYFVASGSSVPLIAYGPHEDENSMAEARGMGCEPVLAKGAFINQLRRLLHP
tara:strand:- start:86 stop:454 length:369 start_codon:yes stop_codon:yes gene_type:complete